jgi:hypothetical protein
VIAREHPLVAGLSLAAGASAGPRRPTIVQIAAVAVGDLRERLRRGSFLAMVVATLGFGWLGFAGHVEMGLGSVRGTLDSAWLGTMMALATSFFVTMVGFYFVKGTVAFDRSSRVGELLATTPLPSWAYLTSKWLANVVLFATSIVILGAATALLQWQRGEAAMELWPLLWPSLVVALPAAMAVAAGAVLFETIPALRGGVGNVVWFFFWSLGAAVVLTGGGVWDWLGMGIVRRDLIADYVAATGAEPGQFTFNIGGGSLSTGAAAFEWNGLDMGLSTVGPRLLVVLASFVVVVLAAAWFDRFSSLRSGGRRRARQASSAVADSWRSAGAVPRLPAFEIRGRLAGLVRAELALAFGTLSWPLRVMMLIPTAILCFAARDAAHGFAVAAALMPILLWSKLGTREHTFGTDQILFAAPRPVGRQVIAAWIAGVVIAGLVLAPWIVRLLLEGAWARAAVAAAGLAMVPALALACGVASGTSRLFEGLYVALWYVGPANQTPNLDWIGGTAGASIVGAAAVVFLVVAMAARARQLRR